MEIPFNLLILPFLGGYLFVRFWNYTKIHVIRSDKERIAIRSALVGLIALMISYSLYIGTTLIPCGRFNWCLYSQWKELVPFEYAGVSLTAFFIAALGWIPLNLLYFTKERELDRVINEDADPLEMLLKQAQDEGFSIAVTMTNEKVYIGLVTHRINPATPTNHIALIPLRSGFRDRESKRMYLKINYSKAFDEMNKRLEQLDQRIRRWQRLLKHAQERNDETGKVTKIGERLQKLFDEWDEIEDVINSFIVIIPASQISSVFVYDNDVYNKYFAPVGQLLEDTIVPAQTSS